MTAAGLALAWLAERPLATLLNALLLALGVATVAALLSFDHQFRDRMTRDARGIDLVVGAKGSRLQLALSAVWHADVPTGNIRVSDAEPLLGHPMVRRAIPLALGDSAGGFRVVGTEASLVELHGAELAGGRLWSAPFEATLGADAAAGLGLALGGEFQSSHGLGAGGPGHADVRYTVVGVLAPTGGVIDRLALTSVESVWLVHDPGGAKAAAGQEREITALLLDFKSPVGAIRLAPAIDRQTPMMAASPAVEAGRLFALLGSGLDVLRGFGAVLVASAALGVLAALTGALEARRRDVAVLRALGAGRLWVAGVLLCEALFLTAAGTALGFALGHGALAAAGAVFAEARGAGLSGLAFAPAEGWLLLGAPLVGPLAAALPAARAWRGEVARELASG